MSGMDDDSSEDLLLQQMGARFVAKAVSIILPPLHPLTWKRKSKHWAVGAATWVDQFCDLQYPLETETNKMRDLGP